MWLLETTTSLLTACACNSRALSAEAALRFVGGFQRTAAQECMLPQALLGIETYIESAGKAE